MKHIKRGRGPSMMDGVASLGVGAFGVVWTIGAVSMGAGPLFAMFGVIFVCIAVGQGIYSLSNATRKNRFSELDIVDSSEEPDPLNERFGEPDGLDGDRVAKPETAAYCPYCGEAVQADYVYCAKCGRRLPE